MGDKNLRVGIFLNKNLLGWGYMKQTTFFRPYVHPFTPFVGQVKIVLGR